MKNQYFVAFSLPTSDIPHKVHAVIPPLEIEFSEDETVLRDRVLKGIAENRGIPAEEIKLLHFRQGDEVG
jgi:hypothetical protein